MTEVEGQNVHDVQTFVTAGHNIVFSLRFNGVREFVLVIEIAGDIANAYGEWNINVSLQSHILFNENYPL